MSRSRVVFALTAVIAASVVFGGVASAVVAPKKVYVCTTPHHHVRVLGTKVKCRKGEGRLSWRIHGSKGDPGARGPAGAPGKVGNVHIVPGNSPLLTDPLEGTVSEVSVWCPTGQQVVGGGFTFANQAPHDVVQEATPVVGPTATGWHVKLVASAPLPGGHFVRAYALCVGM
jgi:hypothetical protein